MGTDPIYYCRVCGDRLPDYPEHAGSCTCGHCTWLYVADGGWFGQGPSTTIRPQLGKKKKVAWRETK